MSEEAQEKFITPKILDYPSWWLGKAQGADFFFHNAVHELIDNSITHTLTPPAASVPRYPTIEVILRDLGEDKVELLVNDNGGGISEDVFENTLMNPGSKPDDPGMLSEHGFGLKNALAFIQSGELKPFDIISKYGESIWKLEGPYSSRMRLCQVEEDEWNQYVITERLRNNRENGTTIRTITNFNVLRTLVNGSSRRRYYRVFDALVNVLREHVMMTYRKIMAKNSSLRIFVISQSQGKADYDYGDTIYLRLEDNSIKIWQHEYEAITRENHVVGFRMPDGKEYRIPFTLGRAPHTVKGLGGNCHNLRYYYHLTDARVGIDIFVRDRLIKTLEWENIWEGSPSYSNNWLIGELELTSVFPTRNNKTNVNHTAPLWIALIDRIKEMDIKPPVRVNVREHPDVLEMIRSKIRSGPYPIVGGPENVKIEETNVFGSSVIDLWFEVTQKGASNIIHLYELKLETSSPLDVYQLRLYCDGFIKDGYIVDDKYLQLHLVAPEHSEGSKECVDYLRTIEDQRGNNYDIYLDKLEILYEPDGQTLRDIQITPQWYPT